MNLFFKYWRSFGPFRSSQSSTSPERTHRIHFQMQIPTVAFREFYLSFHKKKGRKKKKNIHPSASPTKRSGSYHARGALYFFQETLILEWRQLLEFEQRNDLPTTSIVFLVFLFLILSNTGTPIQPCNHIPYSHRVFL